MNRPEQPIHTIYQIRLRGVLDERWTGWFSGLEICMECADPPITLLTAPIPDQSRLRGILNKAWDLNLTVLSVTLIGEQP